VGASENDGFLEGMVVLGWSTTLMPMEMEMEFQLKKKLTPATVLDGIELACGTGCSKEKIEQSLISGWALDPVHPSSHVYAKMALNLIEAVAAPKSNNDSKLRIRHFLSVRVWLEATPPSAVKRAPEIRFRPRGVECR
jgi:hypothetical protein